MIKKIVSNLIMSCFILIPLISHAEISSTKNSPNARQVAATQGYIYTDKGTPILAYKIDPNDPNSPSNTVNNHGWTFVQGELWINNDQIPIILKDEYKEIEFKDIKEKDLLIRYENKKVIYSLTACIPKDGKTNCEHMPQPDIFLFIITPDKKINHPETMKIYRKIKAD